MNAIALVYTTVAGVRGSDAFVSLVKGANGPELVRIAWQPFARGDRN